MLVNSIGLEELEVSFREIIWDGARIWKMGFRCPTCGVNHKYLGSSDVHGMLHSLGVVHAIERDLPLEEITFIGSLYQPLCGLTFFVTRGRVIPF